MSERKEHGLTTTNYTISGAFIIFAVGVVFWGGFVYSQVNQNTDKIEENKGKVEEVSKVAREVSEIQIKQKYIKKDVSEIKAMVQELLREERRGNNG